MNANQREIEIRILNVMDLGEFIYNEDTTFEEFEQYRTLIKEDSEYIINNYKYQTNRKPPVNENIREYELLEPLVCNLKDVYRSNNLTRVLEKKLLKRVTVMQDEYLALGWDTLAKDLYHKWVKYVKYLLYDLGRHFKDLATYLYNRMKYVEKNIEKYQVQDGFFVRENTVEECGICLETKSMCKLKRCGHKLCNVCLDRIRKTRSEWNRFNITECKCPFCRTPFV